MVDLKPVSVSGYVVTPVDLIIVFIAGVITQAILHFIISSNMLINKIIIEVFNDIQKDRPYGIL